MRTIFGAQNVQVENPAWMSGGVQLFSNLGAAVQPHRHHRLRGGRGRADRAPPDAYAARSFRARRDAEPVRWRMRSACRPAASTPTPSASVPALPGLAGCALSQIGNVGPDLGQSYIVDSFMVVVLGGVGQLAGHGVRGDGSRHRQQVPGGVVGRACSRRSRSSCSSSSSSRSARRACSRIKGRMADA